MNGLFDPRSVAVVGASDDPAKWGYWLARGALTGAGRRSVYLVNPRAGEVQGQATYPSVTALPEAPELVALVTPPSTYAAVVEEALASGARYLVAITAGVDRAYPGGHAALAGRVRAAGARLLGPTCMGVYDAAAGLALTWGTLTPGPIGVVSQSGSVGLEIGYLAAREGLGLSRFVSLGAQADLGAGELADAVVAAPHTKAVVLYLEDLALGRELIAIADRARDLGKRVILLAVGGSAAGGRAVRSHTGALATPDAVVDALCEAAGMIRVRTPAEAVHAAQAALAGVAGKRLAVVADSGGQGALAAELAERLGVDVPPLSDPVRAELARLLPEDAGLANPVDLAGAGEADLMTYPETVARVAPDVDAVLLSGYFGAYAADSPALREAEEAAARRLIEVAAATGTPCLVHAMRTDGPAAGLLRAGGVPVFGVVDAPVTALAAVARSAGGIRPRETPSGVEGDVREALQARGVRFPEGAGAATPDEAAEVAERLIAQGPVVLKAVGPAHKTEVGGVVLGLTTPGAVREAANAMARRLAEAGVPLERFLVEAQATGGVELIVGARRDPHLGVVVTAGAGGVLAELIADTATALGPLDPPGARLLLSRTKVGRLLIGWRGGARYDLDGVVRAICVIGEVLAGNSGLAEIEINPLSVTQTGTIALDLLQIRNSQE